MLAKKPGCNPELLLVKGNVSVGESCLSGYISVLTRPEGESGGHFLETVMRM